MPDLDSRVSVLEAEHEHIKESLHELKETSGEIYDLVYAVKENQDKQNGTLPKMCSKIEEIEEAQRKYIIKQEVTGTKVKIMWGIIGVLGTGLVSFVIYSLKDLISP